MTRKVLYKCKFIYYLPFTMMACHCYPWIKPRPENVQCCNGLMCAYCVSMPFAECISNIQNLLILWAALLAGCRDLKCLSSCCLLSHWRPAVCSLVRCCTALRTVRSGFHLHILSYCLDCRETDFSPGLPLSFIFDLVLMPLTQISCMCSSRDVGQHVMCCMQGLRFYPDLLYVQSWSDCRIAPCCTLLPLQ